VDVASMSKDACTIDKSSWEGNNCHQEDHTETLDDYMMENEYEIIK
jgi:hypothetical protein